MLLGVLMVLGELYLEPAKIPKLYKYHTPRQPAILNIWCVCASCIVALSLCIYTISVC